MIPLGEFWHAMFDIFYFLCYFLELRFFIGHRASCMQDFVQSLDRSVRETCLILVMPRVKKKRGHLMK